MNKILEHGIAVVTGGAAGIGKALARQLRDLGMQVAIADFNRDALERTADELRVFGVVTDVSLPASVQSLADAVVARFGTVHLVCNNAGAGVQRSVRHLTLEDWRWTMDVNFWGVLHGVRAFLPILRANAEGGATS